MAIKISVITISYNNRQGLEKTLRSVISQTFSDFEYIVIDGGSQDGSKELLEQYSDKITYWVSETDKGIYNAMNKGIAVAKGEYLIFVNSGDHFYNDSSLADAVKYLSGEDIIYGNLEVVAENHTYIKKYPSELSLFYFYYESLPHPSTFIRKDAFEKWGHYDENLKIVSDWKWFLIAICSHQASFRQIDTTVSTFYLDGISAGAQSQDKINGERDRTFTHHFPLVKDNLKELLGLQNENRKLQNAEKKFNHLKKYRLVKLLHSLGLIKIPD
ncbi:glycosyltransferase family 2 protein [Chryseobacterium caseinilyticum]|uniref:Glycosyltransferase n=1 Tax=Chryseobacterium caseinilyticum TaxID=2771428 RepID=A0ABR8ZG70_9FLAO|nr:glycosyltransferase family 2 protein [Chryseobacterium caseinilyticum]MBD8084304.1 glycosyltransferase [Chryseobacterium caseinilyticum]